MSQAGPAGRGGARGDRHRGRGPGDAGSDVLGWPDASPWEPRRREPASGPGRGRAAEPRRTRLRTSLTSPPERRRRTPGRTRAGCKTRADWPSQRLPGLVNAPGPRPSPFKGFRVAGLRLCETGGVLAGGRVTWGSCVCVTRRLLFRSCAVHGTGGLLQAAVSSNTGRMHTVPEC